MMFCRRCKFYLVGRLREKKGDVYAFRCEICSRPKFIKVDYFWK